MQAGGYIHMDSTMYSVFIGRQPIYDRDLVLYAYELLYRSNSLVNEAGEIDENIATAQVVTNLFMEFGLERLVGKHRAFINLPRGFVVGDLPLPFQCDQIVLEILEDINIDDQVIEGVTDLRSRGYDIALDDFIFHEKLRPLVNASRFVKIDILAMTRMEVSEHVTILRKHDVKLLAEKVETQEDYVFARDLGFDYFQGYFFCRPKIMVQQSIPPNRLAIIRLLGKLQDSRVQVKELAELVTQDVAISFKLIRLLNSAYYALPKKVESVHHAIVYLGMQQIKQLVSLLALANIPDKPHELIGTSLVRAKMCELIAGLRKKSKETGFTVGLFSVLDALMDAPMETLLNSLPLADEIKDAILRHEGEAGLALRCVLAYDEGRWQEVVLPGVESGQITSCYLAAVKWADEVMQSI